MKSVFTCLLALGLAVIVITGVALELGGVVSVDTYSKIDTPRRTHVWFVQAKGQLYLEAGNPANPWVQELPNRNSLTLTGAELDGDYAYRIYADADSHLKIRTLMREKYGWRDRWVSLLFDTSKSRLLLLDRITE